MMYLFQKLKDELPRPWGDSLQQIHPGLRWGMKTEDVKCVTNARGWGWRGLVPSATGLRLSLVPLVWNDQEYFYNTLGGMTGFPTA